MVIDAKLPLPEESSRSSVPPPPSYPSAPPLAHQAQSSAHPDAPPQAVYNTPMPEHYPATYIDMGAQYRNQLWARCASGDHDVTTTFGLCGIICAVLLFPIGLICLCLDSEKKCARCGIRLD